MLAMIVGKIHSYSKNYSYIKQINVVNYDPLNNSKHDLDTIPYDFTPSQVKFHSNDK